MAANALDGNACDAWTDELMRTLGDVPCTQQIAGDPFEAPLAEFFYDALASTHAEPHFLFDEALLDGDLRDAAIAPQRAIFEGRSRGSTRFPRSGGRRTLVLFAREPERARLPPGPL